ncbi:MAG: hypothetical protein VXZ40_04285 [Nanoarchaeota archaeon]|nr:hypothetical protein [Nanoarchaeota archaeon]
MEMIKNNFKDVFSKWYSQLTLVITTILIGSIFIYFTNFELIAGNFGHTYLWWQIIMQLSITILFGLFIPISLYKFLEFNSFSIKENVSSGGGTFLGLLVAGCPACSVTLATYLGLTSLVTLLPWYGLELKIIAIPLLVYANISLLKNLKVCKIKMK